MRKLTFILCIVCSTYAFAPAAQARKPIKTVSSPIASRYIVSLSSGAPADAATRLANKYGGIVRARYNTALRGFAVQMSGSRALNLAQDPAVASVEQDGVVSVTTTTQSPATWGLDRIDQRALPLSNSFSYDNTGAGVNAYVLDTGIRMTHAEFTGRAGPGFDAIGDGRNGSDCHGHGTHVAGTIGGATYGVAKAVALVSVRVLNCRGSGSWSQVISGVDWVAANHIKPAVANMSLGGGASNSLDTAVGNAVAAGVTFVVAAGNETTDACTRSPARAPSAITVGATTSTDARASWSNYGSCLDVFAPGSSITSASYSTDTATTTKSGTSMASPHVAGAASLVLEGEPSATPAAVVSAITTAATVDAVTSAGSGSPNKLLFTGDTSGSSPIVEPPPPPPPPPPSPITLSASGYKVKGSHHVDLSWSGATTSVTISRDGSTIVATTENDGVHTDAINRKGGGTYTYQVCEVDTSICSNTANVTF